MSEAFGISPQQVEEMIREIWEKEDPEFRSIEIDEVGSDQEWAIAAYFAMIISADQALIGVLLGIDTRAPKDAIKYYRQIAETNLPNQTIHTFQEGPETKTASSSEELAEMMKPFVGTPLTFVVFAINHAQTSGEEMKMLIAYRNILTAEQAWSMIQSAVKNNHLPRLQSRSN